MKKIPIPTIERLSLYLNCFRELEASGKEYVSSEELAKLINLNSAQVRKDLVYFGKFGKRGLGYNVYNLKNYISRILGTHKILEELFCFIMVLKQEVLKLLLDSMFPWIRLVGKWTE